jgi:hypothetical protein
MIEEVDEAILEALRKGLAELLPPENVVLGEPGGERPKAVFLNNIDFTVEELGIGSSGGIKKEEVSESLEGDGARKDFQLSQKPLFPLIGVESPLGTARHEPDDFGVDYSGGIISFRLPPEKGKEIQIRYHIAHAVAETRCLKFALSYALTIWAEDQLERDRITLEAVKVLYQERPELEKRGVSDIRLVRGFSEGSALDRRRRASTLQYLVETTISIEMPLPAIERIEIG